MCPEGRPNGTSAAGLSQVSATTINGTDVWDVTLGVEMKPAGRMRYDATVELELQGLRDDDSYVGHPFGDGFMMRDQAADGVTTTRFMVRREATKWRLIVYRQPTGRECVVRNPTGTIAGTDGKVVVNLDCSPLHRIRGTVSGLFSDLTVDVGGDALKTFKPSGNDKNGKQGSRSRFATRTGRMARRSR